MVFKCDVCNSVIKHSCQSKIEKHLNSFEHLLKEMGKIEVYVYMYSTNTHSYIGSTYDLKKRKSEHRSHCFNPKSGKHNTPFYQYIRNNNLTFDDLHFELLETLEVNDKQQKNCQEQYWIEIMSPNLNKNYAQGCNIEKNRIVQSLWQKENYNKNKDEIRKIRTEHYYLNREDRIKKSLEYYYKNKGKK